MLPFHLLYSYPLKERFWESYIYNGKGGELGEHSFSMQLRQPLPMEAEPTSPPQILPLQIPCSLSFWRWL